ncbi:MAG: DUF4982 domain-containing protein [Bacteroidaceae bacterium]|nr:DUF4982 domain-containing protein [Bacteroidaceae bacterium]
MNWKRIALLFLIASFSHFLTPLFAQYEEHREQKASVNRPFADIPVVGDLQEDNTPSLGGGRGRFNFDWRFQLGNPEGAESEQFDDSGWRRLDLPHDFQWEQPWDERAGGARGFKPRCEGWYRKHFRAPEEWRGLEVLLDVGGLMYYGDVFVNGQKVASSEYGYIGFEAEVSRHLHYGADNVVAVYANTGKPNGSRWYTGGGLFRDVWLRLQNPTHVARHGIYVQTLLPTSPHNGGGAKSGNQSPSPSRGRDLGRGSATVNITVDVEGFPHGSGEQPQTLVRATVRDGEGKAVGQAEASVPTLTKHGRDEIALPSIALTKPTLWDIDNPYLYYVEVDVMVDSLLVDRRTERFGVRNIEYSPEFGFKLNGRKVFLKGIANHHDMGALGAASYDDGIRRQFQMMKEFGFNCLRCSHNPYSESLTRIADEMGVLIVDELIDKWSDDEYWGGRKLFMQIWPGLIQEWITRDRNCPSVVLWSLGNELQIRDNWSGYKTNDWGITTYRIFDQMVKRYDRTRPTTVAMFPARAGAIREEKEFKTYFAPPELACQTEVASFNYQWDCYPRYFEYKPDMILFQSEAVTNQLQAPFYGMDRERTVGLAYWGAIEYWGESNKWPKKGWNYSFFSHTLQPYPQAWLIKGAFEPEVPVVRIGVMTGSETVSWNAIDVGQKTYTELWNCKEGSRQQVSTFTNCDEVELVLNGQSLGRRQNDTTDVFRRGIVKWEVPYQAGTLTAIAYNKGKEVARHQIATAGKAVRLIVEEEEITSNLSPLTSNLSPLTSNLSPLTSRQRKALKADGMSLKYLTIRAVDKQGRTVPSFDEPLSVAIEGEATLAGLDNGDHYTDLLFHDVTTKPMRMGYMQVILRSTRKSGKVVVRAQTPSFKTSLKLESK